MLKGQVFDEQLFENDCFAHFINIFLNKNNGITKGCNLTKTNNSVTVNSGYFCIQGRFLKVVGSDTVELVPKAEYCKLICEIDLNKINTETEFKQGNFKILSSTTTYPSLTQQNLDEGGKIYQFEFAQFQNTLNGITNFKDTRKFLDYNSLFEEIEKTIESIENSSEFLPKAGGTATGQIVALAGVKGDLLGNAETTTRLKDRRMITLKGGVLNRSPAYFDGTSDTTITVTDVNPDYLTNPVPISKGGTGISDISNKIIECSIENNIQGNINISYNPLSKICWLNINITPGVAGNSKIIGKIPFGYRPLNEIWGTCNVGRILINFLGEIKIIPEQGRQLENMSEAMTTPTVGQVFWII